jgi:hypothetical protein
MLKMKKKNIEDYKISVAALLEEVRNSKQTAEI